MLTCPAWCRWIGNAAEDGRMASVFARLKVPASDGSGAMDDHGVHAFLVPLRDESGSPAAGVEIRDCGYKVRDLAGSSASPMQRAGCSQTRVAGSLEQAHRMHHAASLLSLKAT